MKEDANDILSLGLRVKFTIVWISDAAGPGRLGIGVPKSRVTVVEPSYGKLMLYGSGPNWW